MNRAFSASLVVVLFFFVCTLTGKMSRGIYSYDSDVIGHVTDSN